MPWTCHAVPAATGRRCGHENGDAPVYGPALLRDPARDVPARIEVCAGCGCTRHASELRAARAAAETRSAFISTVRRALRESPRR